MEKTWRVVLAFMGIFLAGGVTGGFVALRYVARKPPQILQRNVPEQQFVINQMRRFVNELQLSDAQREQVKPVLNRAGEDFRRLRRQNYRETMDIIERMNDQIAAMLSEEQKPKFEDFRFLQRKRIEDTMLGPAKKPFVPLTPKQKQKAAGSQPENAAPAAPASSTATPAATAPAAKK